MQYWKIQKVSWYCWLFVQCASRATSQLVHDLLVPVFQGLSFPLHCATFRWYACFARSAAILLNTTSSRTAARSCCWICRSHLLFTPYEYLLRHFIRTLKPVSMKLLWRIPGEAGFDKTVLNRFETVLKMVWNWFKSTCECSNWFRVPMWRRPWSLSPTIRCVVGVWTWMLGCRLDGVCLLILSSTDVWIVPLQSHPFQ